MIAFQDSAFIITLQSKCSFVQLSGMPIGQHDAT